MRNPGKGSNAGLPMSVSVLCLTLLTRSRAVTIALLTSEIFPGLVLKMLGCSFSDPRWRFRKPLLTPALICASLPLASVHVLYEGVIRRSSQSYSVRQAMLSSAFWLPHEKKSLLTTL